METGSLWRDTQTRLNVWSSAPSWILLRDPAAPKRDRNLTLRWFLSDLPTSAVIGEKTGIFSVTFRITVPGCYFFLSCCVCKGKIFQHFGEYNDAVLQCKTHYMCAHARCQTENRRFVECFWAWKRQTGSNQSE